MGTDLPFYLNAITRQQFLCMVQLCGTICHSVGGKELKGIKVSRAMWKASDTCYGL